MQVLRFPVEPLVFHELLVDIFLSLWLRHEGQTCRVDGDGDTEIGGWGVEFFFCCAELV